MSATRTDAENFILFELAGTTYAVPGRFVERLEMVEQVTPVPNSTPAVEGVVFSRGRVIPAVNLRARFGIEKIPYDLRTRLIVINTDGRVIGLIVDAAREFVSIPPEAIKPPPEAITNLSGEYLAGVATLGERVVLALALDEVIKLGDAAPADAV